MNHFHLPLNEYIILDKYNINKEERLSPIRLPSKYTILSFIHLISLILLQPKKKKKKTKKKKKYNVRRFLNYKIIIDIYIYIYILLGSKSLEQLANCEHKLI